MHSKLNFQLNKKLDKEVCKDFLYLSVGGLDFGKEILKIHPKLKIAYLIKNKKEREKEIDKYIGKYYKIHHSELLKKKESFKKYWKKIERDFFDKASKVFNNQSWPKGRYVCYLSVFSCGPRFLQDKIFQSFYKYPQKILGQQIAHEMLHFIFYDYLYKNYPRYKAKKYEQKIWEISEVFNYVIQNQKEWVKLCGKPILAYPELKELIQRTRKTWQGRRDIDYLLKKILPR